MGLAAGVRAEVVGTEKEEGCEYHSIPSKYGRIGDIRLDRLGDRCVVAAERHNWRAMSTHDKAWKVDAVEEGEDAHSGKDNDLVYRNVEANDRTPLRQRDTLAARVRGQFEHKDLYSGTGTGLVNRSLKENGRTGLGQRDWKSSPSLAAIVPGQLEHLDPHTLCGVSSYRASRHALSL